MSLCHTLNLPSRVPMSYRTVSDFVSHPVSNLSLQITAVPWCQPVNLLSPLPFKRKKTEVTCSDASGISCIEFMPVMLGTYPRKYNIYASALRLLKICERTICCLNEVVTISIIYCCYTCDPLEGRHVNCTQDLKNEMLQSPVRTQLLLL